MFQNTKYKRPFSMDCIGSVYPSHALTMHSAPYALCMGTVLVEQKEEADTKIIAKEERYVQIRMGKVLNKA